VRAARAAKRRACFFATERRFVERAGLSAMQIGEQPTWDPAGWDDTVGGAARLRAQLRRARGKGVEARAVPFAEISDFEAPVRQQIDALVARWLAARRLAPMGFLVQLSPLETSEQARYFVARRGGAVVGFAVAAPIFARGGWMVQHLLRDPGAPNGMTELLVDHVMRAAAAEGVALTTLGLSPLSGRMRLGLQLARRAGGGLFDFAGLRAFRAKLRPARWDPIFLCYPGRLFGRGLLAVHDALSAFARGSLIRFGLGCLRRVGSQREFQSRLPASAATALREKLAGRA
jgi:phosphatidylglycerol lysyltransferase